MTSEWFPADPASLVAVRRLVRDQLKFAGQGMVERGVLMGNELATNAILHGRTDFEVLIEVGAGFMWMGVRDANPRVPVPLGVIGEATNGHGLQLVESLSDRWGITPEPDGKLVWFELAFAITPAGETVGGPTAKSPTARSRSTGSARAGNHHPFEVPTGGHRDGV